MEIVPLVGITWETLVGAFNAAFADYAVAMALTAEELAAMQARRGYVDGDSFGARSSDGSLVGFVLTCRDGRAIYNSGTGVVPSARRTGLARRLVEAVIAATDAEAYWLEVIETNAPAIACYRSLGFVETRRLQSWTCSPAAAPPLGILGATELDALVRDADVAPSWQNTRAAIARSTAAPTILGGERGAVVVFPSGDVPLLVVSRAHRRRGHGTRLLAAAAASCGKPLRIINVDTAATEVARFLTAAGAVPTVRQLEMVRRSTGA